MPRNTIPFPREPPIPRASVCEERHKDIRNHSPHKIHIAPPSVAERFLASEFAADFATPEEATDEPPPSTLYHYQREIASSRKAAKAPPVAVAACARSRLDFEIPLPRSFS